MSAEPVITTSAIEHHVHGRCQCGADSHVYQFPGALADSRTSLGRPAARALGDPWIIRPRTSSDP